MIVPYKQRTLRRYLPVEVYRNLNKEGVWYSIRQEGRVIGHADVISLKDVKFHVGVKGNARVKKTGRKNVHAWADGYLTNYAFARIGKKMTKVFYNPKENKSFVDKGGKKISKARTCVLYSGGVIAYLK